MLVYRVEDAECHGPYIGKLSEDRVDIRSENASKRHWNMRTHPTPFAEGLHRDDDDYCAFYSMDSLRKWFAGDIQWLKRKKFHVSIYEIEPERVKVGKRQVLFKMRYANLVNITDFLGQQL